MIENFHRARRIECSGNGKTYDISIGINLLSELPAIIEHILSETQVSQWIVLTDENVFRLYGNVLRRIFEPHACHLRVIPAGEASKSRQMKSQIEEWMLAHKCSRDSLLVAIGGGVVGDLGGFIAATYMRGIPFIQVPTTLLACVDSSIGGKTGIDSPQGKNLIGAFHPPLAVIIDLHMLVTLPKREFVNGMAEVIKAAAIRSTVFFDFLEAQVDQILDYAQVGESDNHVNEIPLHLKMVGEMIFQSVQIKAQVVLADELEHGLRSILNFGHSIGHGIEALVQPHWLHGECVAMGMIKELEIARRRGICSDVTVGRLLRCLKLYGLPTRIPAQVSSNAVIEKMGVDKKNTGGQKRMILLESIGTVYTMISSRGGSPQITHTVTDDDICLALEPRLELVPGRRAMGNLYVPGSKSISNRVLLLAALGRGSCAIDGLLHSEDTQVMIRALTQLGAEISWQNQGQRCIVTGTGGKLTISGTTSEIYLSNAGTAFRFLTSVVASLVRHCRNDDDDHHRNEEPATTTTLVLTGNHRMKERPIGPLVEALNASGCAISYLNECGYPPLQINLTRGSQSHLAGGNMNLAGKVSSQYVSSVLLTAPYARESLTLQLEEDSPTSLSYIHLTLELMKTFGLDVTTIGLNRYEIPTGIYSNPTQFQIEVDASSATYPLALAAITGGDVTVNGLGHASLQGDAQFHLLLRQMGCTTVQTLESTRVDASNVKKLAAFTMNMEHMTDAFMTAAVLAAVAEGKTVISGIANQRVKECNRIDVMVTELSKLGLDCGALDDGLWISGLGLTIGTIPSNLPSVAIACHNDHRIAMSFAVLGAAIPHVVITDKECTDKTYPGFWDDCEMQLGLNLQPVPVNEKVDEEKLRTLISPKTDIIEEEENFPTIYFIGMRGVGKSRLARALALAQGWDYLDMDDLLTSSEYLNDSIANYVLCHGWPRFRQEEVKCLEALLTRSPRNTIVSTGGGIIETHAGRCLLTAYPFVVHLCRDDMNELVEFLNHHDLTRPELEPLTNSKDHALIWTRREPLYRACSRYDFLISPGDDEESHWNRVAQDCIWFLLHCVLSNAQSMPLLHLESSFFLSLTSSRYDTLDHHHLLTMTANVQALECRIDLLESLEDDFIRVQLTALRRMTRLPLIYTVRSRDQGGDFHGSESEMFHLCRLGLRLACQVLDLESMAWSRTSLDLLLGEIATKDIQTLVIGSHHAVNVNVMSPRLMREYFEACRLNDQVDIIKVVIFPTTDLTISSETNVTLASVARDCTFCGPIIALCTTLGGTLSRVLNRQLTPVTHPLLTKAAAPGQVSVTELLTLRQALGLEPPQSPRRTYVLFGSNLHHSPSPNMHNAGFKYLKIPSTECHYERRDTSCLEDVKAHVNSLNFGGASITIPLKIKVMTLCTSLSPAAQAIGAVNTLVECKEKRGGRIIRGDNTDWLGIVNPISKALGRSPTTLSHEPSQGLALILGAGGTAMAACYAMNVLNLTLLIYNRTESKAHDLARRYRGARVISDLNTTLETFVDLKVIIGTIPSAVQTTLPMTLFTTSHPVVFDAAYYPRMTTLLTQAQEHQCQVIPGAEMLIEQALAQFRLWTSKDIPKDVMAQECYAKLNEM